MTNQNTKLPASPKRTPRASVSPKRKKALLELIRAERVRLDETIGGLSDDQLTEPGVVGDWSVKDILAHLSAWERRLAQRVKGQPETGSELGTPAFNEQVYQQNRSSSLAAVRAEAGASYATVLTLADGLTRAEVNHWWRAFGLNTYSHYRWARGTFGAG
jgi:uncharacterized protein (TIGR03083 family)